MTLVKKLCPSCRTWIDIDQDIKQQPCPNKKCRAPIYVSKMLSDKRHHFGVRLWCPKKVRA